MTTALPHTTSISKREQMVLALIAQGYNSQRTGEALHISINTVQTHRRNMLRKTGFSNTQQLVGWAVGQQLIRV